MPERNMIIIRTIKGDTDTMEGVEDHTPALELSLAIGIQGKIERADDFDPERDKVILYQAERIGRKS